MADITIISVPPAPITVVSASQGLQGPTGISANEFSYTEYLSEYAIGGHRVVRVNNSRKLEYASSADMSHIYSVIGITKNAVNSNEQPDVIKYGDIEEASWSWVTGQPVFLATNGLLTQNTPVKPTSLFLLQVGFATATNRLFIDIKPPMILI